MLVCHLVIVLVGLNVLVLSPRPLPSTVALLICEFSCHNHTLPSHETQICVDSFIHIFFYSFIDTLIHSLIHLFIRTITPAWTSSLFSDLNMCIRRSSTNSEIFQLPVRPEAGPEHVKRRRHRVLERLQRHDPGLEDVPAVPAAVGRLPRPLAGHRGAHQAHRSVLAGSGALLKLPVFSDER